MIRYTRVARCSRGAPADRSRLTSCDAGARNLLGSPRFRRARSHQRAMPRGTASRSFLVPAARGACKRLDWPLDRTGAQPARHGRASVGHGISTAITTKTTLCRVHEADTSAVYRDARRLDACRDSGAWRPGMADRSRAKRRRNRMAIASGTTRSCAFLFAAPPSGGVRGETRAASFVAGKPVTKEARSPGRTIQPVSIVAVAPFWPVYRKALPAARRHDRLVYP